MEGSSIFGIVYSHGTDDDFEIWHDFLLSEEDESAITSILSKYDTQGFSLRGTRKDIADALMGKE